MSRKFEISRKLLIALLVNKYHFYYIIFINQVLSIFCCLGRHDFNVIGVSLLLLSIATYYKKQPELVHKFIVQVLFILVFIDLFWLLIISFVWSHDKGDTDYWKGLSTLHSLIRYAVYGEIILSAIVIVLLFIDYKQTYGNNLNPLNLNYESKKDEIMNY